MATLLAHNGYETQTAEGTVEGAGMLDGQDFIIIDLVQPPEQVAALLADVRIGHPKMRAVGLGSAMNRELDQTFTLPVDPVLLIQWLKR